MHEIAPSVLFYIILYHIIGKISSKNRNKKNRYFAVIGKISSKNKIENVGCFADSGKKTTEAESLASVALLF